jgi:hypothetical protein
MVPPYDIAVHQKKEQTHAFIFYEKLGLNYYLFGQYIKNIYVQEIK